MSDYWVIRQGIMKALSENDDEMLKKIAVAHPGIFNNVVNMAKNQLKKRNGKKKR